jgi:tellurium resistance protein TerZ
MASPDLSPAGIEVPSSLDYGSRACGQGGFYMAVSLTKGQKISLEKEAGTKLTRVVMGLGWDPIKKKGLFGGIKEIEVDLDASCVMFDESGALVDTVWFRQLVSKDGSVTHTGDNRTGAGEGDDEQILVDLHKIPPTVKTLVFVVNSFTGQNFTQIDNATCRIVDSASGKEIAKYNLTCQGAHTAQVMAKIYRHNNEWKLHALGENASGRTFQDLMPAITPHI